MTRRYIIRGGAGFAATAIIAVGGVAAAAGGEGQTRAGAPTTSARTVPSGATAALGVPPIGVTGGIGSSSGGPPQGRVPGGGPPKGGPPKAGALPPGTVPRGGARPARPPATTSTS